MSAKQLLFGIATFVPGVNKLHALRGTGGTDNARYCYSVWLRHLVKSSRNNLNSNPEVVAELGPGSSLGLGLAALISGCENYRALDIVAHANVERNERMFDEILALFEGRAPIPGPDEFPSVRPLLDDYEFPSYILDETRLQRALDGERLEKIRASISRMNEPDSFIQYKAPWSEADVLEEDSVDMLFSQAVLEHVDDLNGAYQAMYKCIKPTGFMSHTIDFKCHGTANKWNGHWAYSEFTWKLIRGKRPYLINREPCGTHMGIMLRYGFEIASEERTKLKSRLGVSQLSPKYESITEDDLTTSGTFVQAVKSAE